MRTSAILTLTAGSLLLTAFACGGDDSDDNTSTGTGGVTTATGGTTGSGGTTTGSGGTTTGLGGTTGGGGTNEEIFVDADTAGLGTGFFGAYNYFDDGGSTVEFTASGGEVCMNGTAAGHGGDYDATWGSGVGLQLVADKEAGESADISGESLLTFTLSGDQIPSDLRVGFLDTSDPENSFFNFEGAGGTVAAGANSLTIAELKQGDWVDPTGTNTLDTTAVTDLQFQVASGTTDVPFDFCISNIRIGDSIGGMGGASGM